MPQQPEAWDPYGVPSAPPYQQRPYSPPQPPAYPRPVPPPPPQQIVIVTPTTPPPRGSKAAATAGWVIALWILSPIIFVALLCVTFVLIGGVTAILPTKAVPTVSAPATP
ncbi:hypothetical protein [Dactylosporangium salmoneum]|uniref:Uncharacterized protein n=1 Tax=Dactylosporangium salmoneum TaxID=53361 RepID=A0ABP5S9V5_9ACTN